jgi:HEAT repeat protein
MSAELIAELSNAAMHLLHAGAGLATNDSRLSTLARSLGRLGAKVPALAHLAEAAGKVAAAGNDAPHALLDLLLLVRQGRAALVGPGGLAGRLATAPASGSWQTALPAPEARALIDLLEKRPNKGWQTLLAAVAKHGGLDLRLVGPALSRIISTYGYHFRYCDRPAPPEWVPPLAPALDQGLDLHGEEEAHAARLDLLVQLDPARGLRHCRDALRDGSPPVRRIALYHLREAPDLPELLPLLLALFSEPVWYLQQETAVLIARVGLPALPALLPLIGDPDPGRSTGAAFALECLTRLEGNPCGAEARAALHDQVPRFLDALATAPNDAIDPMLSLLRHLAPGDPAVSRRLVEILRAEAEADARKRVKRHGLPTHCGTRTESGPRREMILQHLGEHGTPDESALVAIAERARNEPDGEAAFAALNCLVNRARKMPAALDHLLDLFDQRSADHCPAAERVGGLGEQAVPGLPRMMEMVRGRDEGLRLSALQALQMLGPVAAPAAGAVSAAARDRDPQARRLALWTLGTLGAAAPPVAAQALIAGTTDPDFEVRRTAIYSLGKLDSSTPGALDALAACVKDCEAELRWGGLSALTTLKPLNPAALPVFLKALAHKEEYVRWHAVSGVGLFDSQTTGVVDALTGALVRDRAKDVRAHAAEVLGRLRPHTAEVMSALRAALQDKEHDVRWQAALSLGWMGALADPALPDLCRLAKISKPNEAFRKAIQRIEAPPKTRGKKARK